MARRLKSLPVRDEFLIVTNGKASERIYFECLRSCYKSIYKIKVKFYNDDPEALVSHAIADKQPQNRVYCVFDRDEFPDSSIYTAMREAEKHQIGIAFSNIAFEVWLIDHFHQCSASKSARELLRDLNDILKNEGYASGYEKNDEDSVKKNFLPRLNVALQNAEIVRQKKIADFKAFHPGQSNFPVCDWASYTDVHKLILALDLEGLSENTE